MATVKKTSQQLQRINLSKKNIYFEVTKIQETKKTTLSLKCIILVKLIIFIKNIHSF